VTNDRFRELWRALMEAAVDYIVTTEESFAPTTSRLSKMRVYEATKNIQLNLTQWLTGIAQMQAVEIHRHLQEALAILSDPHIDACFGLAERRNLQTFIRVASQEWFGYAPNVSAALSLGSNGHRMFEYIARFDQTAVSDEQFETLVRSAEAWVISTSVHGVSGADDARDD